MPMKTVTALSADSKRKLRVPIVSQVGAFSVAKGVDLRPGIRKLAPYWVVYHTRSGCSMGEGFRAKKDALKMLGFVGKMPGNWDQDVTLIRNSTALQATFREVWMQGLCELGIYKRLG